MKLIDRTVADFTQELASPAPVPGGGGASALAAAIGISLGDMVGELTVGKKRYADVEEDICGLMERSQALRLRFLELVDGDAEAFAPLAKAYGSSWTGTPRLSRLSLRPTGFPRMTLTELRSWRTL